MAYQLMSQLLLVRDGGQGADDEAKQGRVPNHLSSFILQVGEDELCLFPPQRFDSE